MPDIASRVVGIVRIGTSGPVTWLDLNPAAEIADIVANSMRRDRLKAADGCSIVYADRNRLQAELRQAYASLPV